MLISYRYKFIFIANWKAGSGAIERALRPFADVALTKTPVGKHMTFQFMIEKFSFLFRKMDLEKFVIFGVIRNPVTRMLSLYNFHTREAFRGKPHSTYGLSFNEFFDSWMGQQSWMVRPQHQMFTDETGEIKVNFLIDFDKLSDHLQTMFREAYDLSTPLPLGRANVSPKVIGIEDLEPSMIDLIRRTFAEDERIWKDLSGTWIGSKRRIDAATAQDLARAVLLDHNEAKRRRAPPSDEPETRTDAAIRDAPAATRQRNRMRAAKAEADDLRDEIVRLHDRLSALEAENAHLRGRLQEDSSVPLSRT